MTEKQNQVTTSKDENWQYTRCTHCQAVFRIDQSKLLVRKGEVRCGSCRIVFHAPTNIVYRDGDGRFSSLIAKPVAEGNQSRLSKEEAHRAAVRAKMGLESGPSLSGGLSGAYLNRPRPDEAGSDFSKPQESVDEILESFNKSSRASVLDTLETSSSQPEATGLIDSGPERVETSMAQPVFNAPKPDLLESAASGVQESADQNRYDSHSFRSEVEESASRELNEPDLQSIRSAHLESFADSEMNLKEPAFGEPLNSPAIDVGLASQSSISSEIVNDDVEETVGAHNKKTPIQFNQEEENFDTSLLTNTVDDNSEMVELVIPKISSEPLVARQFEEAEDQRSEPVISRETETTSSVSDYSDLNLEAEENTILPSDFESVDAAREALIFGPLSDIDQRHGPKLEVLVTEEINLAEDDVNVANEIELPQIDSNDTNTQSYGETSTQVSPRFEPFVPPPPAVTETASASEALIDQWKVQDDSLLDHNPFSPKFETTESRVEEVAEIKMDPRPAAINMSGVDEYIVDRPNPLAGVFWSLVSVAFVVLLGLQVKYFLVERFAQHEAYRPYLQVFCKVARCELPPRRDAYRFTITQTRVDLHPQEPGALRITVRLLNQADFSQPYPELRLTLTDRVGRVVGRRKFDPDFYLQKGTSTQLASGELGYVVFDLASPHEKAVGFVVDVVRRSI